ncbi:MAG: hypothetical protein HYY50_05225 [Candidatus Kerfeldbacteria bacterium]|nr:hypothetical protein [Candidatus Kerfeldbacteria bacterium]
MGKLKRLTCEQFRGLVSSNVTGAGISEDEVDQLAEHANHCGWCCTWVDTDLGGPPGYLEEAQRHRILSLAEGKDPDDRFDDEAT